MRTPLGVVGIIYESRPNVTADAGGLCLKSGNAAILRGGSESFHSSAAIVGALHEGLAAAGLPKGCIQLVPVRDRAAVGAMLSMRGAVDVVVPRGGKGLIQRVLDEARVPVIGHLEGLCHVYVDGAADLEKARRVAINAKMRRTGICGAAETILFDRAVAESHMPAILDDLIAAGCEVRGDADVCAMDGRAVPAGEEDWNTEYLDAVISARVVDGVEGAVSHIRRYGSQHTDTILTEDEAAAEHFLAHVDSAIVLHNASTQFADGGEFGFGAEIGISTDKFHARGPVGAEQLTSYKYVVRGRRYGEALSGASGPRPPRAGGGAYRPSRRFLQSRPRRTPAYLARSAEAATPRPRVVAGVAAEPAQGGGRHGAAGGEGGCRRCGRRPPAHSCFPRWKRNSAPATASTPCRP